MGGGRRSLRHLLGRVRRWVAAKVQQMLHALEGDDVHALDQRVKVEAIHVQHRGSAPRRRARFVQQKILYGSQLLKVTAAAVGWLRRAAHRLVVSPLLVELPMRRRVPRYQQEGHHRHACLGRRQRRVVAADRRCHRARQQVWVRVEAFHDEAFALAQALDELGREP